ncbi:MAG: alpha amylase C-terminal domain-containing protein [Pirellulaceae bacterium]
MGGFSPTWILHYHDFEGQGFEWIDCHDATQSVLSYLRRNGEEFTVTVLNLTPVPRYDYRIGVPLDGSYREVLNSDATVYGGSGTANGELEAETREWMGRPYSLRLTLPPLAGIVIRPVTAEGSEP